MYEVEFDASKMCFVLTHKIYFARIMTAHYEGVMFIGDNEEEVIADLLSELEKEFSKPNPMPTQHPDNHE